MQAISIKNVSLEQALAGNEQIGTTGDLQITAEMGIMEGAFLKKWVMMLDLLRHKFVRYSSLFIVPVGVALHLVTGMGLGEARSSVIFTVVAFALLSLFLSVKFPQKSWGIWLMPIVLLVTLLVTTPSYVENYGFTMSMAYIVYPVVCFFLLGIRWGIITSAMLFISVIVHFVLNGCNPRITGFPFGNFITLYFLEIVLLAALEWTHQYLLKMIHLKTYRDELTGLKNRAGISLDIATAVQKRKPFFLILSDLDFSLMNANLGHDVSDRIIVEHGKILSQHSRASVARWGGDQFCILFSGSRKELDVYLADSQRLLHLVAERVDVEVEISFSCGIVPFPLKGVEEGSLVSLAVLALEEAQKGDRGEFYTFEMSNLEAKKRRVRIAQDIVPAIRRGEVEVHFQPKISMKNPKVAGMEALVRWIHPELGFISPPEFIEIAEYSGDIVPLSEFVIEKALAHLRVCQQICEQKMSVSVNISPLHILHSRFIPHLVEIVRRHQLEPSDIILEITENVMLEKNMLDHLAQIKEQGFKVSLDDFGTGYSSLSYLHQFPFDELKIDKSFTDGLLAGEKEIGLFEAILNIAKHFKMSTVVEGLEEKSQLDQLKNMKADEIQGWYYSRALPVDEFLTYLEKMNGGEPAD